MGSWTDSVEAKAHIIHEQMSAARDLAKKNGADVSDASKYYLELLRKLYEEEFPFAQIADSSDLVARYVGPALLLHDPSISLVTGVFSSLRKEIRSIAKSIAGLSDARLKWPSELDPNISGIAQGSLVVGISVPPPSADEYTGQGQLEGVSDQLFLTVKSAVKSISSIAKYIEKDGINEDISQEFPDPAIRDTVMVAASRLSPTGKKGIDSVSFIGSEDSQPVALTPQSRKTLNQSLRQPIKVEGAGDFEGVVREIDLDACRFEIRNVKAHGSIRCVYSSQMNEIVKNILDSRIEVKGSYETYENQRPRLITVDEIKIISGPDEQLDIDLNNT